ncbi:hypothetical protein CC1G_12941 [Coprinopsis cinerea okayama7|uniref:Uncharacterized protein n=1 Tax=Coprinopsis cinerea (strain Okayama-7 / 130 / ATCC MYA-4618 / FGSC 9003) TaxID=240176 RepID=A8PAH9_COPC7|nr:hypothetical protein CC1G_12941 [Coprinopsis cinerea okayama7\|eukprot:XP_001839990.1 hypothetical protein CC1G_12941 [Coprinopsis cinerea okayama7\
MSILLSSLTTTLPRNLSRNLSLMHRASRRRNTRPGSSKLGVDDLKRMLETILGLMAQDGHQTVGDLNLEFAHAETLFGKLIDTDDWESKLEEKDQGSSDRHGSHTRRARKIFIAMDSTRNSLNQWIVMAQKILEQA